MSDPSAGVLDDYRRKAGLSRDELWLRYFALGGMSSALQVEAFLYDALLPTSHDHDVLAHALNERFVELGGNHPVPYINNDHILKPSDEEGGTGDGLGSDRPE